MAFSPGGIIPLLFPIWLGFPDGLVVNCYHLGMVRYFLLESCRPDDKYLLSVRDDLERKLTEEGDFHLKRVLRSCKPSRSKFSNHRIVIT